MSLYHNDKYLSLEEARKYNCENSFARRQYGGCISSYACEHCGLVCHDSICCCIGIKCPKCNKLSGGCAIVEQFRNQPIQEQPIIPASTGIRLSDGIVPISTGIVGNWDTGIYSPIFPISGQFVLTPFPTGSGQLPYLIKG